MGRRGWVGWVAGLCSVRWRVTKGRKGHAHEEEESELLEKSAPT